MQLAGAWEQLTGALEAGASQGCYFAHVGFYLRALFPAGALIGSFRVCRCSHSFTFTEKRARCFPFLSLVLQQFWQQGRPRLERSGRGQELVRGGPGAEARGEPLSERMAAGEAPEHAQGKRERGQTRGSSETRGIFAEELVSWMQHMVI